MKYGLGMCGALFVLSLVGSPVVTAQSEAVQTMAGILLTLNHFPSDAEKASLKAIADDTEATAHERAVARALMNVEHQVAAGDKAQLQAVLDDGSAPESLKTLATVLMNLEHAPSDAEKEKLKALAS